MARAWYQLGRQPAELSPEERANLASWPVELRAAPSHCFAEVEEIPEAGPHDPGGLRFRRLLPEPSWPWPLAKQASLEFEAGWDAKAVAALAHWQPLRQLESLHVGAQGQQGAMALAQVLRGNPQLRILSCNLLGADAEAVLEVLQTLPLGLEALTLQWVRCDLDGRLGQALTRLPKLQSLALEFTPLGPAAWEGLVDAGLLTRLGQLRLHNTYFDDATAAIWLRATPSQTLRHLDLEDSPFNGRPLLVHGLQRLAEAGWLDGLEFLRIGYHAVEGPVLAAILAADLRQLRQWLLFCTGTDDDELEQVLAARQRLPELRRLWLSYCRVSDAAQQRLAAVWSAEELDGPP